MLPLGYRVGSLNVIGPLANGMSALWTLQARDKLPWATWAHSYDGISRPLGGACPGLLDGDPFSHRGTTLAAIHGASQRDLR